VWVLVAVLAGVVRAETVACPVPADRLPDSVPLRTAAEGFNARWEVALRDDRLCLRERGSSGAWRLLGETGRPEGGGLQRPADAPMVAMSVDGTHLQVELADGRLLRATDMRRKSAPRTVSWTDHWGWPAGRGPGLRAPDGRQAFVVSDSHPFQVRHYRDVAGQRHPVGLGVAHHYRLSEDGRVLYLNDWWLPADWSRRVCLPPGGPAADLSASGSTLMVRMADGRVYTRLYDVDTAGENDLLTYTWSTEGPRGPSRSVRALPAEGWLEHGLPEAEVFGRVSIHQDGRGNAARVLRLEGEKDGVAGVFEKRIDALSWRFVPVPGHRVEVWEAVSVDAGPTGAAWVGTLGREGKPGRVELRVTEGDGLCSPARLGVWIDGVPVQTAGGPLVLTLQLVPGFVTEVRPADWRAQGTLEPVRGALLGLERVAGVVDPVHHDLLEAILGPVDRGWVPVVGEAGASTVRVAEMTRGHRFGVRRAEKGRQGDRVVLSAAQQ